MSLPKAVEDVLYTQEALQHGAWETAGEYNHLLNEANKAIEALRQAYAEPYVPMTDDEFIALLDKSDTFNRYSGWEWEKEVESAVLARQGIEVGK